jgi:hypothetical protein
MRSQSTVTFAIIRYNLRTYEPGGVMAVIKGRAKADAAITQFEIEQSREDRAAGWGYFLEQSDLQPGMDPEKATSLRQTRQDVIETRAQELELKASNLSMLNRRE